jgi:hypothetical protein
MWAVPLVLWAVAIYASRGRNTLSEPK